MTSDTEHEWRSTRVGYAVVIVASTWLTEMLLMLDEDSRVASSFSSFLLAILLQIVANNLTNKVHIMVAEEKR